MERNGGGGELRVGRFPAAAAGYMSGRASEETFGVSIRFRSKVCEYNPYSEM